MYVFGGYTDGTSLIPDSRSDVYDPATNSATVTYAALPESNYELDLPNYLWADAAGNYLDGSGVGYGGDYVVDFSTDATTTPLPTPLQLAQAMGVVAMGGTFHQTRLVQQVQGSS